MQLLGQNTAELETLFQQVGQPSYRGRQVARWIYQSGAESFDAMSDLGKNLRRDLQQVHQLRFPTIANEARSRDGSIKYLLEMQDGERIETVFLPYENRVSVCVSSQAGCAMGCKFCATGLGGFRRNLSAAEIISQVLLAARHTPSKCPSHIVFMGMGEPLLNLREVLKTIHLMHDEMGISLRHITVSTVGILDGIRRLAEEKLPVTLAVSLHAPDDDLRHRLIPTSAKISVRQIVDAAKNYVQQTGRRVSFEYVVLGGVNDDTARAAQLAALCRGWPCHVNLIPWNNVPEASLQGTEFHAPEREQLARFRDTLEKRGVTVTQRVQRGADVAGACGQLRARQELIQIGGLA
jgi:23S rRNA (adenine2503-C2)-methyltransferase